MVSFDAPPRDTIMYTSTATRNAGLKYAEFGSFSLFIVARTWMYVRVAAAAMSAALDGSRK